MTLNLGSSRWAHCRYTPIRSARQRRLSLSSPLVFQRAVAIPAKFTRRGSPVGLISFDMHGERQEFDTVVADHTKILVDSVACASRSRWRQKVRRQGCLVGIRNDVRPAALAPHGKVLGSLSVPNDWVSDAGINALQAHRLSISVHPVPLTMLAEGGRIAGRSSVSPQAAGARKRAASPGEARKSAGLGSQKSA
jgi:hypothetical protein